MKAINVTLRGLKKKTERWERPEQISGTRIGIHLSFFHWLKP